MSADHTTDEKRAACFQKAFFRRVGRNVETLRLLAEQVPGVLFNIVDDRDRIVAFNRENCANCNFRNESEAIGRKVTDLFPPILADSYLELYHKVRRSGKPVLNQPTRSAADRSSSVRLANVFPIHSADGKQVVGTAAFYRITTESSSDDVGLESIRKATDFVERHFAERLTNARLAAVAELTLPTFRRLFKERMQIGPNDYVTTIRINHARRLLAETNRSVESIAAECGFCDASHFVRSFRKCRRETPTEYRRKTRVAADPPHPDNRLRERISR